MTGITVQGSHAGCRPVLPSTHVVTDADGAITPPGALPIRDPNSARWSNNTDQSFSFPIMDADGSLTPPGSLPIVDPSQARWGSKTLQPTDFPVYDASGHLTPPGQQPRK